MKRLTIALVLVAVAAARPAGAQEAPETPPPPLWKGSLGFSYVATSGNADTQTFGSDATLEREPSPWGVKFGASFTRAEQDGELTAERYGARGRAERAYGDRWSWFGGLHAERDQFAGYDLRAVAESGAIYNALLGPVHTLSFDAGATYTSEDLVDADRRSYLGGLLGATYEWKLGERSAVTERLVLYPNVEETDDWRAVSEAALKAAINDHLALQLAWEVRYDNEAVPGFEKTDQTTKMSLVLSF